MRLRCSDGRYGPPGTSARSTTLTLESLALPRLETISVSDWRRTRSSSSARRVDTSTLRLSYSTDAVFRRMTSPLRRVIS